MQADMQGCFRRPLWRQAYCAVQILSDCVGYTKTPRDEENGFYRWRGEVVPKAGGEFKRTQAND